MKEQPMLVKPGTKVKLDDYDPDYHGDYKKRDPRVEAKLLEDQRAMRNLQMRLYAEGKQALLIVLQAMDCGGKDGTIKHVMHPLNPQSCYVVSFRAPTEEELAHDFLWRVHRRVPAKGQIAVFNRSHYEDVLVVRVRGLAPKRVWRARYKQINQFERLLAETGTRILKFFLHISRKEQKVRLEERLSDPRKRWKFRPDDLEDRELWDDYMKAYEDALTLCSTPWAPWYIIPANRKWYRNMVVADIIAATLRDMDPQWPDPQIDPDDYTIT
ncbi:MAG: polyphosphate kinase 2 family protein [Armatimonadetes bacterium]|nr:polyphosphate kinase 2 family protein [Armatimonadota bacterium]